MEPKRRRRKGTGSINYRADRHRWEGVLRVGGKSRYVYADDRETLEKRLDELCSDPVATRRPTLSERVAELEVALAEARSALAQLLASQRTPLPQALRTRVMMRDGRRCRYCGVDLTSEPIAIDHIVPWSKGGRNTDDNLVVACRPCNHAKKAKLPPSEWMKYRQPLAHPIIWVQ